MKFLRYKNIKLVYYLIVCKPLNYQGLNLLQEGFENKNIELVCHSIIVKWLYHSHYFIYLKTFYQCHYLNIVYQF